MKRLIYLLALPLVFIASCKKEESKKASSQLKVIYNFETIGEPSKIVYTSIKDGKTITLNNANTSPGASNVYPAYKISDDVKLGDHITLEMSCSKNMLGYSINITQVIDSGNGNTYERPIVGNPTKSNSGGIYKVTLDHTFTSDDFR